ncbi:MAG TPA: transglycosylase SLT domain-containing protein [Treponemataceae bacterium]|jgi:soluble lytic murein transglycosylase-like protein|nr:MAG: Transglycosylase SLT domain protein [Spirochaetes bacterium ADurb.Bin269]HOC29720.1 transglycosylase SLT domain-containing protein [Treponemataceae bacterium]HQL32346.1 transglycosylase SLT domain-containing protein [Treponemataceae bacterium]
MMQNNAKRSHYPQKVLLAVFIFGLVILSTKIVLSQFNTISLSLTENTETAELASMVAPELFNETAIKTGKAADPALILYRNDISKADVLWFYTHITGNETITRIILDHASKNNIPPSLAFSLAWEESRYQIKAVNKNASSIDRGLFQLNNKAFPKLTEKDFFNPETNARNGLNHLRYCIDLSGNEIAALAMYNAGTTKVRNNNTPKRTLDYVSRILNYKDGLETLFMQQVASRYTLGKDTSVRLAKK